ncbi:MAG: hypothetical protein HOP29_06500 [Phycisphaerales bacterium]|nr:hypothetical protein [Phycisphaerales bacterium]
MGHPDGGWRWTAIICLALSFSQTGCATVRGYLATDSGPSSVGWSTLDEQFVHAGERVAFSFVISKSANAAAPLDPVGIVDYCDATIDGRHVAVELDDGGHFRFGGDVGDRAHGAGIVVTAAVYRQDGQQDAMLIGDEWVQAENPYDQHDRLLAGDSVRLIVYRSEIDLPVRPPDGVPLDLSRGRLEILRKDGSSTHIATGGAASDGFEYSGPNADGAFHVHYLPAAGQLNKTGSTTVRFTAPLPDGGEYAVEAYLATP